MFHGVLLWNIVPGQMFHLEKEAGMAQRMLGESGYHHVAIRSAGQIALFEDDGDRRHFLRLLREARDEAGVRIIAWVLMTDHVHILVDVRDQADALSRFMYLIDKNYARYFNYKTGRSGHLFQGRFWNKPIKTDAQLIATVHYIHMNPENAGLGPMRSYRWSSFQEYAGKRWVVDTEVVLGIFGSFEAFDAYAGSPKDVVKRFTRGKYQDEDVLALALELSGRASSNDLRALPREERNRTIVLLKSEGVPQRMIARTMGIGLGTVSRILSS